MKELSISLTIDDAKRIHAILEGILNNRRFEKGSMFRESHIYNIDNEDISAMENLLPLLKPKDVEDKTTYPILKQFHEMKEKFPDVVLLFRCGDFYESYNEDAVTCADILGIVLTEIKESNIKMAGFPHHALDTYLPKLIRAGKRVAICDQLEYQKNKIPCTN